MTDTARNQTVGLGTLVRCWRIMRVTEADLPTSTAAISDGIVRSVESGTVFGPVRGERTAAPGEARSPADLAAVADGTAAELGLQTWRLQRRVHALDAERNPKEYRQLMDSCRRFERLLESMGVEVVDPVGREYVDGWIEVEVVSWEPASATEQSQKPLVKRTVSPIIRRSGAIIQRGQVIVTEPVASIQPRE